MYIYNVTINIDEAVHDQWLKWMRDTHIPDMLKTGKFVKAKMCRVLVEEETGGITYSVQYTTKDKATLEQYYKEDSERLRKDGMQRYANKFVAFRTELEVISEQRQAVASATEYLFTYGTLQDQAVQTAVFSRTLKGSNDLLSGHKIATEQVAGLYPTVITSNKATDSVKGQVYAVSSADLLSADDYEGAAYKRKEIILDSGIQAWVYFERSNHS